jgi:predicted XRE-type DNA-binding protein
MLRFRNLTVSPTDPVDTWGVEGVLAAIDRGGLAEWRRIARAVHEAPYGAAAADLEQALDVAEGVGAAAALRASLERARMSEAQRLGRKLGEYVARSGLSQAEVARRVGTSPSRMSTYVSGKVVPSGVLVERARKLSERPYVDA